MTARTPNGNMVTVQENGVGTRGREGRIFFGTILVCYYCSSSSAGNMAKSLEEGLEKADVKIDKLSLAE